MNSKDSIGQVGGGHELILDKAKILPDSNMVTLIKIIIEFSLIVFILIPF